MNEKNEFESVFEVMIGELKRETKIELKDEFDEQIKVKIKMKKKKKISQIIKKKQKSVKMVKEIESVIEDNLNGYEKTNKMIRNKIVEEQNLFLNEIEKGE